MDSLPELARDATESVERQARNLLPWLPTPMSCQKCGAMCETSHTYDPQTAAFHSGGMAPSWECPNEDCGEVYRRVEPWHSD